MRLDKYLSYSLNITRKQAKNLIKDKQILINNQLVLDSNYHIDVDNDVVSCQGEVIEYEQFVYYMLNKPAGVISATIDNQYETVLDLIEPNDCKKGLFPVGRLDIDTEGLLILTNNGKLGHLLTNPKNHVKKKYYVEVQGELTNKDVEIFAKGMNLPDFKKGFIKTLPAELEILTTGDISTCYVTIFEGKYHQIKRMFEHVNKEVIYLKRIMIKGVYLDETLEPGEYRRLTAEELRCLKEGFNL